MRVRSSGTGRNFNAECSKVSGTLRAMCNKTFWNFLPTFAVSSDVLDLPNPFQELFTSHLDEKGESNKISKWFSQLPKKQILGVSFSPSTPLKIDVRTKSTSGACFEAG